MYALLNNSTSIYIFYLYIIIKKRFTGRNKAFRTNDDPEKKKDVGTGAKYFHIRSLEAKQQLCGRVYKN